MARPGLFELMLNFVIGAIPGAIVGFIWYAFHYRVEDIFQPELRHAVIRSIGGSGVVTGLLFTLFRPTLRHW